MQDAYCPHLGAHLGHGGAVEGCELRCPFHGWRFDAEGNNTDIPYSERTNRKARLRTFPVVERNGMSLVWYHPDPDVEPMWEIPELPEFNGDPDWSTVMRTEHVVDAAWQEMAENGVDSAHFRFVHNTAEVPEMESYETGFPGSDMRSSQKFPTPRGVMEGRIDSTDDRSRRLARELQRHRRHAQPGGAPRRSRPTSASSASTSASAPWATRRPPRSVGRAFVREVDRQVLEDKPIWEHKAHLVRPALADNDGPFTKFRKWAAQFYAEPWATSACCIRHRTGPTGSTRRPRRRPPQPATMTLRLGSGLGSPAPKAHSVRMAFRWEHETKPFSDDEQPLAPARFVVEQIGDDCFRLTHTFRYRRGDGSDLVVTPDALGSTTHVHPLVHVLVREPARTPHTGRAGPRSADP